MNTQRRRRSFLNRPGVRLVALDHAFACSLSGTAIANVAPTINAAIDATRADLVAGLPRLPVSPTRWLATR